MLLALAIVAVKLGVVKTETFPASSSRFVQVNVRTPNGTSVAVTNGVVAKGRRRAACAIRASTDVSASVGSAFGGGGSRVVTNQASLAVALKPGDRRLGRGRFRHGVEPPARRHLARPAGRRRRG